MMPNKTKIPNSKNTNNNVSDVKTDASFLPLELVIGDLTNDNNSNTTTRHDEYITKSILEFFNLALPSSNGSEKSVDWTKTKKIIDALNFIRFGGANPAASSDQSAATLSLGQHQPMTSSGDSKQGVPCFSLVLLTNSPSTCRPLVDQDHESSEEVIGSARNWFFHYKIELNDDRGKPIARQVFYRLKSPTSSSLPLCCRSNWISPMQQQRSPALPTSSPAPPPPTKYIVRLNINCQNYDLMLFFYRLLFEKCPNYSKKDFSLFILSQHRYPLCETSNTEQSGNKSNNNDEMIVEFQLSLKHDESCVRAIEKLPSTYLVFNVDERRTFDNIVHLLDGFVEPIVYGKIYSVLDPDRNRVFIVDRSSSSSLSSSTGLVVDTTTKLEECASSPSADTIGLADKYYSLFNNWSHLLSPKSKQQPSSYSPNSNCSSCSSSETSSFDSGKDSGNWSGSNSNPIMKCAKVLNEQFLSINNNTPTPIINNISHNNNGLFSKDFNYKQLHSLPGNYDLLTECQTNNNSQEKRLNKQQQQQQQQLDASNADYIGVKHLIKKFSAALNPNPTDTINNRSISSSVCSNKPASKERKRQTAAAAAVISNFAKFNHHHTRVISDDSEDYDEYSGDEEEDNERELRNLLKKASNSSMFALNALAYKNKSNYNYPLLGNHIHRRPKQEPQLKSDSMNHKQSLIDLTYRRNPRSRSALNEPYLPTNPSSAQEYNQFNNNSRHFNTIDYNNHHSRNHHQHNRSHRQQYDNSNQYSHQSRPSSIGYSAGTRLLKSVLHSTNSNNSSGYNNLIDSSCSSLNRKKSKSVTFMDALSNSHQQQGSKSNKSFIGTTADEGNISNRRDFLANPIISNNLMSRSKSTVPFFKPDHANNRPYSDYNDDDEYRYNEDEYDYDDQDEYESYTCVDVDNYNSSSGGDLRSTTPTSANKGYLDSNTKMAKLISNGISYHDYLSFCEQQQQQQQPQTSLIDDLRASRRGARDNIESKYNCSNQQAKPYVGITAATRFRRAHTLDMIRSTKMPLNAIPDIKQQPQKHHHQQQQSIKSNDPQSFNFINKNNSSPLQFNSSKLVARF